MYKRAGLYSILLATLLMTACPRMQEQTQGQEIFYPRIILDTYVPTEALASLMSGVDALDLYRLSGGSLQLIASDHIGNNPDLDASGFAYIDYQKGLKSGTYYIHVGSTDSSNSTYMGAYAIRVLTAPDVQPRNNGWYFSADNTNDAVWSKVFSGTSFSEAGGPLNTNSYEPDNGGPPTVQPLASMSIDWALNRYLGSSTDLDWIILTLP